MKIHGVSGDSIEMPLATYITLVIMQGVEEEDLVMEESAHDQVDDVEVVEP